MFPSISHLSLLFPILLTTLFAKQCFAASSSSSLPLTEAGATSPSHEPPPSSDPYDLTKSQFMGLMTYANLPYLHCLRDEKVGEEWDGERYDVVVLGAPFDTAVTGRPGARFGPQGIRRGSQRITPETAWDPYTLKNVFQDWATIVDCGDVPMTWLDNEVALKQLDKAHRIISSRPAKASHIAPVPRIITLGGDHTTTLSALRSTYNHFGPTSVIHFDSHIDSWDPAVLGGPVSPYASTNHGTFLHHAAHAGYLHANSSIHAGIRCPYDGTAPHDLTNDAKCGFSIITARSIDLPTIGIPGIIAAIKKRVGDTAVYISVDIDVLDPAYAPGTGTAEVGGWSTRELLSILDGLVGLKVVGGDVVEVAPAYDNGGETTVLAASEVVRSLIALMVEVPVVPGDGAGKEGKRVAKDEL